ncbi:NAD(P)-dependent oxidoreductase [Natribacillus halophilus]|uniref:Putative NADH-flavin reductase n=1 Tax=Natribacillus halophilus TaxID=549003 RepID=A0A1G8MLA7_9BACI|nr:NAD(P)H-binding protein [Natribacillus halophilus]SDI68647.1 Putative NADH-flavin reductase [Natribacillus halophilus]
MKILLLGATGRVGNIIAGLAVNDQHHINALVRSPEKLDIANDRLTIHQGNVLDQQKLSEAMVDADIIINALNTDKNDTLSRSMPLIIQEMKHHGIKRIITIGTAGILNSRTEEGRYRFQSSESKRRSTTAAEDHLAAYHYLKESNLQWLIVCPTALINGSAEGNYRVEENYLPENGKRISVGDTADFAYRQMSQQEAFIHTRVGIAY